MIDSLLQQFSSRWAKQKFGQPNNTFLLTVSGGVDSMVMADLFLKSNINFSVAHCNFRLRGEEANLDEQLVVDWCNTNNINVFIARFETKQKSIEWKKGIQETARILRYEWFEQLMVENGYTRIVTAHHANDNVETLLINLCKGTGISGLHGILPDNGKIIRPLLFATKEMLTEYAAKNNIIFREDASNNTDDYLRNAVRRNVIPVLSDLFGNAVGNINESIGRFGEVELLYRKAIEQERKKLIEKRGQDYYIPILKLVKHEPLVTIVYELLLPFGFVSTQTPQVLNLLLAESGHYVASASHRIIRNRDFFIITALPTIETDIVVVETTPCKIEVKNKKFSFSIENKPNIIPADTDIAYLDAKGIQFPVFLRKWRTGDYFYPFGMKMKKKKVSRFLIDEKVALHDKENIWVLECNKRIAWVAGMRPDERFKVKDSTEKVLVVKLNRE